MANWSNFFGGSGYSLINGRSHVRVKVAKWLRKRSTLADRAQLVALIAASGATTGNNLRRREYVANSNYQPYILGGLRPTEQISTTTGRADSNMTVLNAASNIKFRPSYVADRSGNGGKALT